MGIWDVKKMLPGKEINWRENWEEKSEGLDREGLSVFIEMEAYASPKLSALR